MLQRLFQHFIFSNIFIAALAWLMVFHTQYCFGLGHPTILGVFVLSATLCSYTLHWYLTHGNQGLRATWTHQYRHILLGLLLLASPVYMYTSYRLMTYYYLLFPLAFFTFLYTAPKIPYYPFILLRGKAIAKTLYLTTMWSLVTVVLPLVISPKQWDSQMSIFLIHRFSLIFVICAIFDYRDRLQDIDIKNFITRLSLTQFRYAAILLLGLHSVLGIFLPFPFQNLLPTLVAIGIYFTANQKNNFKNDFWYYAALDGLMGASGLLCVLDYWFF